MAVGNNEFLLPHLCPHQRDDSWVVDWAEPVENTVFIPNPEPFPRVWLEHPIDLGRGVTVEHEELPEVGAGGAQQLQTIGFRLGERLFMAEDDARVVVFDTSQGDEAGAGQSGSRSWSRKS